VPLSTNLDVFLGDSTQNSGEESQMRYWLIGSGSEKKRWSYWRKNNFIAIGFKIETDLSDLSEAKIKSHLKKVSRASPPNVKACTDFTHVMKPGDIAVVREGETDLVGICRVLTDYFYDESLPDYRNIRGVEWISTERHENGDKIKFPRKTLLDFSDQEHRSWLKRYVEEKIIDEQDFDWNTDAPDLTQSESTEYTAARSNQLEGYVYVIGLEAYPGKYKIGHANDINKRVRELGTAVPERFTVHHYEFFNDSARAEGEIHQLLSDCRLRGEWFKRGLGHIKRCVKEAKISEPR
jgi:hypothetical protein